MNEIKMRPELKPLPERMQNQPLDKRGFPVPWFVSWINGEPEFRTMDGKKLKVAIQLGLCWCCGQPLGTYKVYVIGPMCCINRISSEPPSHLECARWSANNCPFLTQRQMKRREDEQINSKCPVAGISIERNPGVIALWITKRPLRTVRPPNGGVLFDIGEPEAIEWYSHGRRATLAEIKESVETGLPALTDLAAQQPGATAALAKDVMRFVDLLAKDVMRFVDLLPKE